VKKQKIIKLSNKTSKIKSMNDSLKSTKNYNADRSSEVTLKGVIIDTSKAECGCKFFKDGYLQVNSANERYVAMCIYNTYIKQIEETVNCISEDMSKALEHLGNIEFSRMYLFKLMDCCQALHTDNKLSLLNDELSPADEIDFDLFQP
jgi:hypothetical protein